jgi:hypothetical protein
MSVYVGSAWKIFPITARSLWSVLGGGERQSLVKHGVGGPAGGTGGERSGEGGHERERIGRGKARTKKDRAKESSTGALCTGFTLVLFNTLSFVFSVMHTSLRKNKI